MRPSIVLAIALLSGSLPLAAQQVPTGVSGGQASFGVAGQQSQGGVAHKGWVVQLGQYWMQAPGIQNGVQYATPGIQNWMHQVANCPAKLSVSHLADGSMILTGSRAGRTHSNGIGQWLHITLMVSKGAVATLAVHGFSNQGRMTETNLGSSPDAVRTVAVYLAPAQNGQAAGNIWAPELTAVTAIDLVSLSYDDGTNWSSPSGHACRVTPDPLMLISGR